VWLRWLRARQGTEAPAELIDVRKRCSVMSRQLMRVMLIIGALRER
jgi:hypothetical protein